jgi:hypothetical protein
VKKLNLMIDPKSESGTFSGESRPASSVKEIPPGIVKRVPNAGKSLEHLI